MQDNIIKEIFDLKELGDTIVVNSRIEGNIKIITLERKLTPVYCPLCNEIMHSQGFYIRHVDHSILNDGYKLVLEVKQRKYRCTNPNCNHYMNESFSFVERYKHKSYITPYLILEDLKDLSSSVSSIARRRKVSDTYVHNLILTHLEFKRLPLSEALSIDEVFLDIDEEARYCVVLRDFINDKIIDILPNRNKATFDDYFIHIPKEERNKVKYILCDMYNPYINLTNTYFTKAEAVIDSFHVIQWINNRINLYINDVKKRYQKIDDDKRKELNYKENKNFTRRKESKEVYLLKRHKWVLLSNVNNIEYHEYRHLNRHLGKYVNTSDIEKDFLSLDDNFPEIRRLKEMYISFNTSDNTDMQYLNDELDKIIITYKESNLKMFKEFGKLLENHKKEILNSFIKFKITPKDDDTTELYRRLSNGPMEGFNRKPKDLKRLGRGYNNFDSVRNRILWSIRDDASFLGSPKPLKEVREKHQGPKRGPYNKNK